MSPFVFPDVNAIRQTVTEAQHQVLVAREYGLPLEWYVRAQDLTFFNSLLEDVGYIRLIPYW